MADYTANRIKNATLAANTVDRVTLNRDSHSYFEVTNVDGAGAIYVRTDGVDPTVAGDECDVLPAVVGSIVLPHNGRNRNTNPVIRLISDAAVKYSVKGY